MLNLILFLLTAWAATAAGRTLLAWRRLGGEWTRLEVNLIAFGLGLSLLAAGMLVLGLAHALYPVYGWGLLALLGLSGARQHGVMAGELRTFAAGRPRLTPGGWGLTLCFAAFAMVSLTGCFAPPTLLEWDSVAYHMADPKMYLLAHAIYYIPWEDHSNFGFTAEMWYLWAMLVRGTDAGVPLAKLFHFACAAGACLTVYAFGARYLSPTVGKVAALTFAATPFVFWEAGTAYVDLATVFYTALTGLALAQGIAARDDKAVRLSAVLMGLTLSTKATALGTLGLLGLGVLLWRLRGLRQPVLPAILATAGWGALALLVGSPWLIKSFVYTGNPVYPFAYGLFGGHGWSAAADDFYNTWNKSFGMGHSLSDAVLVPWNMTLFLVPGHPTPFPKPFNDYQTALQSWSPLLLAALFFPAFLPKNGPKAPPTVLALGSFALGSGLLWLAAAQYARYLLPALPAFCLLAAWVLVRAVEGRWRAGYALAGLGVLSLGFSLLIGGLLLAVQAPIVLGQEPREAYITHGFAPYPAMQYVNTTLPANAKLVFYGNPLGFYCDRPYVWGEPTHGTFIPYDTFHSAEDLRQFLTAHGYTHLLVSTAYYPPPAPGANDYTAWVYALTQGSGPPLFFSHGVGVWAIPEGPPSLYHR